MYVEWVCMFKVQMLIHKDREGDTGMKKEPFSRVSMALKYRIKEFVTHPNCQQVSLLQLMHSMQKCTLYSLLFGFLQQF